eukprot:8631312-Alexandrium_andersonii.AAC.2
MAFDRVVRVSGFRDWDSVVPSCTWTPKGRRPKGHCHRTRSDSCGGCSCGLENDSSQELAVDFSHDLNALG